MTQEELRQLRIIIQQNGWGSFMSNIGSLMAEQADKTEGNQSGALFAGSSTIHALKDCWNACGFLEYPEELIQ
jgi:hypothetical protein